MNTVREWINNHASAILFSLMFFGGLVGIIWGVQLSHQAESKKVTGDILIQVSGPIMTIGLTVLFFSLPDMKKSLKEMVSHIIASNEWIGLLPENARLDLIRKVYAVRAGVAPLAGREREQLFAHIDAIMMSSLKSAHLTNMSHKKKYSRVPNRPHLVEQSVHYSYRIIPPEGALNHVHPVECITEWSIPDADAPEKKEWIKKIYLNYDNLELSVSHEEWAKAVSGAPDDATYRINGFAISFTKRDGTITCSLSYKKNCLIHTAVQLEIHAVMLCSAVDTVDLRMAPYPCDSFEATVDFDESYVFECMFAGATGSGAVIFDRDKPTLTPGGLIYKTKDWVLPGEGVVIYHYPRSASAQVKAPIEAKEAGVPMSGEAKVS